MPNIISAVAGLLGFGAGGGGVRRAAASIFPNAQAASKPVMPIADDDAVQAARRRSLLNQTKRRGRASTVMTGDEDTLG